MAQNKHKSITFLIRTSEDRVFVLGIYSGTECVLLSSPVDSPVVRRRLTSFHFRLFAAAVVRVVRSRPYNENQLSLVIHW